MNFLQWSQRRRVVLKKQKLGLQNCLKKVVLNKEWWDYNYSFYNYLFVKRQDYNYSCYVRNVIFYCSVFVVCSFQFHLFWVLCWVFWFGLIWSGLVQINIITSHTLVQWVHKSNDRSDTFQWIYKAWIKLQFISRGIINSYDLSHSCTLSRCCIKSRELQMKD